MSKDYFRGYLDALEMMSRVIARRAPQARFAGMDVSEWSMTLRDAIASTSRHVEQLRDAAPSTGAVDIAREGTAP